MAGAGVEPGIFRFLLIFTLKTTRPLLGSNEGSARNLSLNCKAYLQEYPEEIKESTSHIQFIPFSMMVGEEMRQSSLLAALTTAMLHRVLKRELY